MDIERRADYIESMSPEIITMLGVGVAIVAFLWRTMTGMEQRLDKRFDRLESKVDALAKDHANLAGELTELRGSVAKQTTEFRGSVAEEIAGLRRDVAEQITELRESLAEEMAELRERMARLEGLFEGFIRREPPAEAPAAE